MKRILLVTLLAALPAVAQKDYLTADEADQMREAQEPTARLKLLASFARQRVEIVEQTLGKDQAGRAGFVHDVLDQYSQIIEAIDTNADDALKRGKTIESFADVAKTEREMLQRLEKIRASNPKDLNRFQFVLDQAIDATRDSAELSEQDVQVRAKEATEKDKAYKAEHEGLTAPVDKPKPTAEAKPATDAPKRKPPTLRRPGDPTPPPQK